MATMAAVTLCILSALLISAQGLEETSGNIIGDLKDQHEGLMSEMKGLVMEYAKSAQDHIDQQVQQLHATIKQARADGLQAVNDKYDHSRAQIAMLSAPKICLDAADQELLAAKEQVKGSILTCSNLTQAGKDVVSIGGEALKLAAGLLISADDVLNGMSKCWSFNPFKFFPCTFSWMKTSFSDIIDSFKMMSGFTKKVGDLVMDIKNQIAFCVHGGEKAVIQDTVATLQRVYACTNKLQPATQ